MKKIILLSTLLINSIAFAKGYEYEISPLVGINSTEGDFGFKHHAYTTGALEFQMDIPDSSISPEISVIYAPNVKYKDGGVTDVMRIMADGVYYLGKAATTTPFRRIAKVRPFVKAGIGMEYFSTNKHDNEDKAIGNVGIGLKTFFAKEYALKFEVMYLNNGTKKSNVVSLAGLTYTFEQKEERHVYREEYQEIPLEKSYNQNQQENLYTTPQDFDTTSTVVDQQEDIYAEPQDSSVVETSPVEIVSQDLDNPVLDSEPQDSQVTQFENLQGDNSLNLHIKFRYKSTKVADSSYDTIARFAQYLRNHPDYSAVIIGYSDNIGSARYNRKLSKKRAQEVVDLLIENGAKPSQLTAIGKGESNPIASNDTPEGRAKNRRIETQIIK